MKEKLIKNLGIKILSVCLAMFLWIIIINVDDPVKTRTFTNVPVQVLNENTLTSKNKAYGIVSGDTVDFTVTGKRTQLEELKKTDFVATADLAQLAPPFETVKINVECTKYPDIGITMGKVTTMRISLEDIISENFSVRVVTSGAPSPGYAADKSEASPVMIEVTGAESTIKEITDVKVLVDISSAEEDVTKTVTPKAYNEKGIEIDSSKLSFSYDKVSVKVTILPTKTIPIVLSMTGQPEHGYQFLEAAYEPKEIEIKGESEKLNAISSLTIPVDISNLQSDKEDTIDIQEYLEPFDVSVVDQDVESIVVKVYVEKLIEKTFTIEQSDIKLENLPENMKCEFTDVDTSYVIKLMGLEEDFKDLTVSELAPVVDLDGLTKGNHKVILELTLPEGMEILTNAKVGIKLEEAEEAEQPEPSQKPEDNNDVENPSDTEETVEPSVEPSQTPSHSPVTPEVEEDTDDEE